MSIALLLGGALYFGLVSGWSVGFDRLPQPGLPSIALYTVLLIALVAIGHVAIAVFAPKEASAAIDERERRIIERAGHLASYVLGAGVVFSLGYYLLAGDGDILFYSVLASLMIGQLAEYAIRIVLFRTGM